MRFPWHIRTVGIWKLAWAARGDMNHEHGIDDEGPGHGLLPPAGRQSANGNGRKSSSRPRRNAEEPDPGSLKIMTMPENLEILALRNMINSSEAMFDRRRRILREARQIISEQGLQDLNMRELSRRAAVSTKTIYNAFGSKETVIALAIYTYFQQFISHMHFSQDSADFEGALSRQTTSTLRDVDIPNYMKALIALYFSTTLHPAIRAVLLDLATRSWIDWLNIVEDRRELEPGVVLRELLIDLSNLQYGRIQEWCSGLVDDDIFVRKSLSGILLLLMGATCGKTREQVQKTFFALQSDTGFRTKLFSDARQRITEMEASIAKSRGRKQSLSKVVL